MIEIKNATLEVRADFQTSAPLEVTRQQQNLACYSLVLLYAFGLRHHRRHDGPSVLP